MPASVGTSERVSRWRWPGKEGILGPGTREGQEHTLVEMGQGGQAEGDGHCPQVREFRTLGENFLGILMGGRSGAKNAFVHTEMELEVGEKVKAIFG